jgi:large subunit ribosomal protein L25
LPEGVTALTHGQNLTVATAAIPAGQVAADAEADAAAAAAASAASASEEPKK